jgi:hypothetical protein
MRPVGRPPTRSWSRPRQTSPGGRRGDDIGPGTLRLAVVGGCFVAYATGEAGPGGGGGRGLGGKTEPRYLESEERLVLGAARAPAQHSSLGVGVWAMPEGEAGALGRWGQGGARTGVCGGQWSAFLAAAGAHRVGLDLSEQQLEGAGLLIPTSVEAVAMSPSATKSAAVHEIARSSARSHRRRSAEQRPRLVLAPGEGWCRSGDSLRTPSARALLAKLAVVEVDRDAGPNTCLRDLVLDGDVLHRHDAEVLDDRRYPLQQT